MGSTYAIVFILGPVTSIIHGVKSSPIPPLYPRESDDSVIFGRATWLLLFGFGVLDDGYMR
jgi:hypothetical protein